MRTSTKTLLASIIAVACASGAYAQGAGGGAGGSAGAGSTGGGGTGAGMHGGAAPSGNTLEQPGIQPGMNGANTKGGYGSPGTTGTSSGRSTVSPRMRHHRSGTTGNSTTPQDESLHEGHQ
ncbi:MAG TPA: hypothetical protein VF446_05525 [Trinickia sp.]